MTYVPAQVVRPVACPLGVSLPLLWLAGCSVAGPAPATRGDNDPVRVEYTVRLREPQTQTVDISLTVRGLPGETVDFVLPAWRPGRYAINDHAGTVRTVAAAAAAGGPLPIAKTDKSTWRVTRGAASDVRLDYTIYANSLADRTRHVDDTHAFLSGAAVFMFVPEWRAEPLRVRVEAPQGWRTATGLERAGGANTFFAPNYDVLVDSPLEIGRHELLTFDVDGVPHEVAIWGRSNHRLRDVSGDFAKIVRSQRDIFGDFPYTRYVFLLHCAPGARGGTEHLNSTIMQAAPTVFDTLAAYRGFLGLVSHEFFHTWNVKQLRPAGMHPYDYVHENYTDLLWVAEGTTSYYDDLTLARTELLPRKDYFKMIADGHSGLLATPGRRLQSLAQSSFDAWIKFNRATPDSANSTVNFYSKGALASLLLDMELRQRTGNRVSLDDVMREMYRAFPLSGPGYTTPDLLATLERLSGTSFAEFHDRYVAGNDELPLAAALAVAGLDLALEPVTGDDEPERKAYTGLRLVDRAGATTVESVLSDGPAYTAGVQAADEVVALNGVRLKAADLDARLRLVGEGDPVRLTLLRRDELHEIEFTPLWRPNEKWACKQVKEPSDDQRAVFESWMKQPWDSAAAKKHDDDASP